MSGHIASDNSANTNTDDERQRLRRERRMDRRFSLLTASAFIIAIASLITSLGTLYLHFMSSVNSSHQMTQLVAALKEQQPIIINGTVPTSDPAVELNSQPSHQPNQPRQEVQSPQGQGGQSGQVSQPAQPEVNTPPAPSADELLRNAMAAAEPGVPGPQLAAHAVDGLAASTTLEQVAQVRAKMAPPPGLGIVGDVARFEVRDVRSNGTAATATLVVVWPAGLGEWTYPDSGFQYVDGEWKLQKSSVCNLAKAAWVDCY